MIRLIRGFRDILPPEAGLWQQAEKVARSLFEDFGFDEIRIPVMEYTDLFSRSIGEETDIVEKEMYTFPDRKGDLITLRPEATASIVRSYIQHKLHSPDAVRKFYTIGPMFRRERPQKGRYRQFYQINAEVFGIDSPHMDGQLILMLTALLSRLDVKDVQTHINSLGCPSCRPHFKTALTAFLADRTDRLCEDCTRRSIKNPLRVLDCKVPSCMEVMTDPPALSDYLCDPCRDHFSSVLNCLERFDLPFVVDKSLVRGLDYYTRTTFEVQTRALGAQSAVAGGGRYDGLVKALGGPDRPAVGFAVGLDRLVEIMDGRTDRLIKKPDIYIAALGDRCKAAATEWGSDLSLAGIRTEIDLSDRSLKSQMKRADRLSARYVLIVGEREIEEGSALLRHMTTKEQAVVPLDGLPDRIREKIGSPD